MIQNFDKNISRGDNEHARQSVVRNLLVDTIDLIVPQTLEHLLKIRESVGINEII